MRSQLQQNCQKELPTMKHKQTLSILLLIGFILPFSIGCQGLDRTHESVVKATDPDRARIQSNLKWLNPQPRIRPVSSDQMYVFCRVKNSSGTDVDLRRAILDEVEAQGYRLTRNVDEAQFTLTADLRYLGETATKQHDAVVGSAIIGGIAGAVIGNNSGGRTGEGAAIGAVAGALLGDVTEKRNKDREFTLVVDVIIGERIRGGVNTTREGNQSGSVQSSNAQRTGAGYETGRSDAGSSERQIYETTEEFLYHENRVTASAKRLNLTLEEATPSLTRRLSRAISSALP